MKLLEDTFTLVGALISIPMFLLMLLVSLPFAFGTASDDMPWAA